MEIEAVAKLLNAQKFPMANQTDVEELNGDVTSGLARSLAAEIAFLSFSAKGKAFSMAQHRC
jgi:hypothetical protein